MNTDYLNQITPKPSKKTLIPQSKPIMIGIVALGVIILVTIIGILAGVSAGNIGDNERLAARLLATQDIVNSATNNIKNTQLLGMNSALNLYLTNTIRDITPILSKNNINIKKLSKNVTNTESDTKILATLEDARLNAVYDRIYASQMSHQLDITIILMQKIFNSTSNTSLKSFLANAYQTLQPTQQQFADFNATDG